MKELHGRTALVTGASGGLGTHIAHALAREGMHVAVSGRRENALATVVAQLRGLGVRAEGVPVDLSDLGEIDSLIDRTEDQLGPIDVLVNNAGIEIASTFTHLSRAELTETIDVNLTAAMLLTHRVVPGMLDRRRGHVVFVSSAAGKLGPACQAPYAASKAALVGLNQSLRAEYAKEPIGFSVVCPGFVAGDGMYQRMLDEGFRSSPLVGQTTVEKIVDRTVWAIRHDVPEVVVTGAPVRPWLALGQIAPRLAEMAVARFGADGMLRQVAASRGRLDPTQATDS